MAALLTTSLPLSARRGKVRDVYDLGDRLLMISTDRISAFDWVMPNGIPDKGRVLTQLSAFWFERLGVPHHVDMVVEQLSAPEARYQATNRYWVDPTDGFVWKSEQQVLPGVRMTLVQLRPYRGDRH